MVRYWTILLLTLVLAGCDEPSARMEHPEDPQGRYSIQIAAAKRLLNQREDWADRVEWEVLKSGDGWQVIAWRIEHPERKGPSRYLPWGYSTIDLDQRNTAVKYHRKG